MERRSLLCFLVASIIGTATSPPAVAFARRGALIRKSPLAVFQRHAGQTLWGRFRVDASLQLQCEPDIVQDSSAVAAYFSGQRIGYLPRLENTVVSQMLDRGERLTSHVITLWEGSDPRRRVRSVGWVEA